MYRRHPWVVGVSKALLVVVPLGFLCWNLSANWEDLQQYDWQFNGTAGALAVVCLMAAFGVLPVGSQQALRAFGYSLDYRDAFRGYFLAQPAKYLPGGVWVLPGRALALSEVGVKVVHSGAAQVIEGCFMLVGAVVVFTPYLIFGDTGPMPVAGVAGCFVAAAALLCLHPALFNRTATWILRRLGQAAVEVRLSARIVIGMLLTYVGFWVVAGVGFYLLVSSVHEVPVNLAALLLAAMSMAWVIGFIAFLAPAGAGVREGALALLLAPILPSPLPAALALMARIWWTAAELILVLAAVISRRRTESQPD